MEFKQYLSKLQKPEDIANEFCDNLKMSVKEKFKSGIKRSVNHLYVVIKQN